MKYFSMFSGIGGFESGIERAYKNVSSSERLQQGRGDGKDMPSIDRSKFSSEPLCIGFSEVNKYAVQIYQRHYPGHKNYGDATRIVPEELPDFDLLCGGFPCQAFSIAGKRGGFKDTRGTLFFEIARILAVKRPQLLLLENVKGLLSHDRGRTFGTILATLSELGYLCEWQVLNSKDFGVPQNRERVFIVGHLGGEGGGEVFPVGKDCEADIELPTLTARYWGGQANGGYLREITKDQPQGQRVYETEGISQTISSGGGGLGAKTGLYAVPLKYLERNQKNFQGEYSFTVDTVNTGGIMKEQRIRRLTPTECERLQGFPDGWTEGLSDSQRYKCLGNAVTVNVIAAIMNKLFNTAQPKTNND